MDHHRAGIDTDEGLVCYKTSTLSSKSRRGFLIASNAKDLQHVHVDREMLSLRIPLPYTL